MMYLAEPYAVVDIFAEKVARVEVLGGGNVRFTYSVAMTAENGSMEHVVVARIVMPVAAIAPSRETANAAMVRAIKVAKPAHGRAS